MASTKLEILPTVASARDCCDTARAGGGRVGLVPTMGYLHEGHRSLMRFARAANDLVVVSIYVNPLQFGAGEDLSRYPRDLDGDARVCKEEGVDMIFAPTDAEMYPSGEPATTVSVRGLTNSMCGAFRPGHFDGVTTVVAKLFAIVGPSRAYFGRKDAQQLAVIERMTTDLNLPVEVVGCPLVREPDGLARSSRNAYLTPEQRAVAPGVFAALRRGVERIVAGERDALLVAETIRAEIDALPGGDAQYVEIRAANTLTPLARIEGDVLIAVAAHFGGTRLIDNVRMGVDGAHVDADFGTGWQA